MNQRWWFLAILLGAIVLRVAVMSGAIFQDDGYYIQAAFALSRGEAVPSSVWAARIGLVGPVAIIYYLFGVSLWTTAAFSFCCSIGSVVATYVFGRLLLDERSARVAMLCAAIFPLDVLFSGILMATAPVTLFCGLGVGLFLLAEARERIALYVAAGAAFGLAGVIHEAAPVVLVVYPIYALMVARPRRRQLFFVAGLVAALAVDPIVHGMLGNVLARVLPLTRSTIAGTGPVDSMPNGLDWAWLIEPFKRLLTEQELGLFPVVIVAAGVVQLLRPDSRSLRGLAVYTLFGSLWLLYGTLSPMRYHPLVRTPRYLAPLVVPALLLVGHALAGRTWRARGAIALLVGSSLFCVAMDGGRAQVTPYQALAARLAALHVERVVMEPGYAGRLRFVEGFRLPYALDTNIDDPAPSGTIFVADTDEANHRLGARSDLERLDTIPRPASLYRWFLANHWVKVLLAATRPGARVHALAKQERAWALALYRAR